jgi:hypothetical protein
MSFRIKLFFFFLALGLAGIASAQSVGNSPYSLLGVGDLYSPGFIPNTAMGGTGVSNGSGAYVNNINPALLSRTKIVYFEAGLFLQSKGLTEGDRTQQITSGTLNYLSLAFPASNRWTMSITLMPYSRVDYSSRASSLLFRSITDFNIVNYSYKGTGGLTRASFTNGYDLVRTYADPLEKKNLRQLVSIGLESAFLFGNTTKESLSKINASNGSYDVGFEERINYSDFSFKPGLAIRQRLRDKVFLNIGGTYTFGGNINAKRLSVVQQRSNAPIIDTLEYKSAGSVFFPQQTQFGLSLESPYHWAIAADIAYQPWSQFNSFGANAGLSNSYRYAIGGEYTPNLGAVEGYFKRVTYRLGLNHTQTPYVIEGRQIVDQSLSFGFSFPMLPPSTVERGSAYSDLNLAFVLGQRGADSPIKEQYFKIFVGFTLRDNQWFRKRKVD